MSGQSNMSMLGIDLGNWSCFVIYDEGFSPRDIEFGYEYTDVKTQISQIKSLLGRKFSDPELQLELDYVPFRVIEGPKGYPLVHTRCKGQDRAFTPVEILAMLISSEDFQEPTHHYHSSPSPCIGIPIYFTDQQKMDVLQAAKIGGLPASICLLDETTAMVMAQEFIKPQCIVAFVDIGHASMQVCFAEYKGDLSTGRSVNILYKGYARSLGGREFDKVLFKHFASKIRKKYNIDVSENSSACVRLSEACESLKCDLSKNNETSICLEKLSGLIDVKVSMMRKDFESLSISVFKKIEVVLKKALSESGLTVEKIDYIEAVGKGCSIPTIIDTLTKIFGKKPKVTTYCDHVARGCALPVREHNITGTDKMINDLTTGLETSELVSSELNSEEEMSEGLEKVLWRRAMQEEGHLLTFLNDFLEENMHRIGRSEKTKIESFWLDKADPKHTEQLISERDDARKLSEAPQNLTEELMSKRDDARKLSETAQKFTKELMSNRDDPRELSEAAWKHIEQLMSERDDVIKLSEADQKLIEQLTSERDHARELLEAAHKLTEQLVFEKDDTIKLSEVAQKRIEQLMSERDDARKLLETAQKLKEQLMSERDDARKEVEELRRLTELQSVGYFAQYSYSELQHATNNFHDSFKLGEGGYGIVYKGNLHNTTIAIKVLKEGSSQGAKEFHQEIEILSKVRHPNLVTLIGACAENRAVIYEYLPNGSLEDRLRCKNNTSPLLWQTRIRIAFEICSALSFLHCSKPHGIVHGDLKPENILLDSNNVSKISDFGLCRELKWTAGATVAYHLTEYPKGTLPYMDPEYLSMGKITPQSDVYSFGIMLLRLVTCQEPRGIRYLVEEARQTKGTLKRLIKTSGGGWPSKVAQKMISLGLRCSDPVRRNRPDLSTEVWKEMKSIAEVSSAPQSPWAASLIRRG